jgi:hypothetical protein
MRGGGRGNLVPRPRPVRPPSIQASDPRWTPVEHPSNTRWPPVSQRVRRVGPVRRKTSLSLSGLRALSVEKPKIRPPRLRVKKTENPAPFQHFSPKNLKSFGHFNHFNGDPKKPRHFNISEWKFPPRRLSVLSLSRRSPGRRRMTSR